MLQHLCSALFCSTLTSGSHSHFTHTKLSHIPASSTLQLPEESVHQPDTAQHMQQRHHNHCAPYVHIQKCLPLSL
ncbi:hypothetical protein E2C01_084444 [Portunus trituberculatus]|uniref:Uncharacterized protein n=1 Tax=Portunus trituberculatus TaxID=210409 RepID=A0A5B7J4U6_PORTR|nr:hypothetical protein [Portunus trituberculatus]